MSDLVRQRRGRAIERDHRRVPSRVDRAEGALRDCDVRSDANARRHTPAAFFERRDRELRFPPSGAKHEHGSKHHRVTRVGRGGERGSRCANGSDNRASSSSLAPPGASVSMAPASSASETASPLAEASRTRVTPLGSAAGSATTAAAPMGRERRPAHRPASAREGTEPIACARIGSRVEDDSHLRCRRQCPPDKRTPQIATSDDHAGRDRRPNRAPQQRRNRRHRDHTERALARAGAPRSARESIHDDVDAELRVVDREEPLVVRVVAPLGAIVLVAVQHGNAVPAHGGEQVRVDEVVAPPVQLVATC